MTSSRDGFLRRGRLWFLRPGRWRGKRDEDRWDPQQKKEKMKRFKLKFLNWKKNALKNLCGSASSPKRIGSCLFFLLPVKSWRRAPRSFRLNPERRDFPFFVFLCFFWSVFMPTSTGSDGEIDGQEKPNKKKGKQEPQPVMRCRGTAKEKPKKPRGSIWPCNAEQILFGFFLSLFSQKSARRPTVLPWNRSCRHLADGFSTCSVGLFVQPRRKR